MPGRPHGRRVPGIVMTLSLGLLLATGTAAGQQGQVVGRAARRDVTTTPENTTPGVFTYHNDWARTGQNLQETTLTPASVTPSRFGLLKTDFEVDGFVYAQPLYVPDVAITGTAYTIVVVATEHDSVYAFDADIDQHPQHWASPLWSRSLLAAGETPMPTPDIVNPAGDVCSDIRPEVGITSTPVVDPATEIMYVVAKVKEPDGSYAFWLHAIDLTTGLEAAGSGAPVRVGATVPGTGDDAVAAGGTSVVSFNARRENQRAALALVNGIVYVGFASYCDQIPYHGWLLGYDTTAGLKQVAALNPSADGLYGGIWAAGGAPAIDATGTMYLQIANGPYNPAIGEWGDAIVALPDDRASVLGGHFDPLDYFEPFNQDYLYANDRDAGSGGMLLLPDQPGPYPHEMIGGGKQGLLYVLNRDRLTTGDAHQNPCGDADLAALAAQETSTPSATRTDTCDPVVQVVENVTDGEVEDPAGARTFQGAGVFDTPAYWNGHVYLGGSGGTLKMFALQGGLLVNQPVSQSAHVFAFPGVTASISADGDRNGIVWAVDSGYVSGSPAVLYAFDAGNLSHVLYESAGSDADQAAGLAPPGDRDAMGTGVKFSVPTVYGGKVFVATEHALYVFGPLN